MRYYLLSITDPKTGEPPVDARGNPIGPFDTSKTPGRGLHIEFDAVITGLDVVNSGTMMAIYGLPMDVLKQSVKLNGCQVSLIAGFSKGLPLANRHQQGEIINGEIFRAYANWIGTNQSLNLVINPALRRDENDNPISMSAYGKKGEKLSDVIVRSLKDVFPKKKIKCSISDKLVLPEDFPLEYRLISSLASVVRDISHDMMRDDTYSGVSMVMQSDSILIYDNHTADWDSPKEILAHELIGQPTWIKPFVISFKCPMRGEVRNGNVVSLPQGMISGPSSILMTNTTQASARIKDTVTFSGKFLIRSVRHVGAFLVADGDSWVTVFEGIAQTR